MIILSSTESQRNPHDAGHEQIDRDAEHPPISSLLVRVSKVELARHKAHDDKRLNMPAKTAPALTQ
jgi:hypothetical protein